MRLPSLASRPAAGASDLQSLKERPCCLRDRHRVNQQKREAQRKEREESASESESEEWKARKGTRLPAPARQIKRTFACWSCCPSNEPAVSSAHFSRQGPQAKKNLKRPKRGAF